MHVLCVGGRGGEGNVEEEPDQAVLDAVDASSERGGSMVRARHECLGGKEECRRVGRDLPSRIGVT